MAFDHLRQGALALALVVLSGRAHAQASAAKRETARELMVEARQLRERGDLEGALSRFRAADAIMNVPTTAFEVAATRAKLGKLVEAREDLLRLLAIPQRPDDPEPFNEARAKARALAQELLARLGSIVFTTNVSEGDDLDVTIDGETVPQAVLGLPFRVNPGPHQIVARSRDRSLWRGVDVAEGQVVDAPLIFEQPRPAATPEYPAAAAPAVRARQTRAPDSSTPKPAPQSGARSLAYVGTGIGALGIGIGTAAGISAILHKSSAEKDCIKNACPSATWRDLQTARNMATTSNVGFVAGGVGLALLVGSLWWDRAGRPRQGWWVTPEVSRQGGCMNLARRF